MPNDTASYETLRYEIDDDGILTLTLNRPDQLNAFTVQMADDLENAFRRASVDDDVRAIVVTGEGRAFCAGMDLSVAGNVFGLDEGLQPMLADMVDRIDEPEIAQGVRDTGGRVTLAIFECTKPVIAAVNGAAVGIGATMLCAMDVRIASEKARIGFVFGKIGITPEAASTWFLPRIVGISRALEWVYSAEILTAEEAREGGLVRSVHAPEELLEAAYALARKFTQNRSPGGHRPGPADDVPQQRGRPPAGRPSGRLAGDLLPEPRGREGRRALVPGEAGSRVHLEDVADAAVLPVVVTTRS